MSKRNWNNITPEQWALGYPALSKLLGVTGQACRAAHQRVQEGRATGSGTKPVPIPAGLKATDSPTDIAARYGVSVTTASKWLAKLGRVGTVGRPANQPEGNAS